MLNTEAKQFKLMENGEICFQPNPTNPLPGDVIAHIRKGQDIYHPDIALLDSVLSADIDRAAAADHVQTMVRTNIAATLEQLYQLNENIDELSPPVRGILHQLHEALGFIPRPQVEDLIADIDSDGRYALRKKGVKLGPILVFIPQLGKPAAVRMRALLWTLWNEGELPAEVPRDGSVSQLLDNDKISLNYYRMIGYPVFGKRAIRADMLDRLVNEIYDTAKEGKFQAQHKMAEWLGCTIPELYQILTDLGHRKIHDPAEQAEPQAEQTPPSENLTPEPSEVPENTAQETPATPENAEAPLETEAKQEEEKTETAPAAPALPKPELATFAIKRGKAADRMKKAAPRHQKDNTQKSKYASKGKKSSFNIKDKKSSGKRDQRVLHAEAKKDEDDSPFAVLKDLKLGNEK